MLTTDKIKICHACPNRGRPEHGNMPCRIHPEQQDIISIAERGDCPAGMFPAAGCDEAAEKSFTQRMIHGVKGIARAMAGLGEASPALVDYRTSICNTCEHWKDRRCELCGCWTWAKVRNAGEKCPKDKWPAVDPAKDRWFGHTGACGDIIYALPAIRDSGGGRLFIYPDLGAPSQGYMTPQRFAAVEPLLKLQPYIREAVYLDKMLSRPHRLDSFRELQITKGDLVSLHYQAMGISAPECSLTPWLTVDRTEAIAPVIFARSSRYSNPDRFELWNRNYDRYGKHAAFVGTESEHATFENEVGRIRHVPTANLLEVARIIAGCELFCGNQSAPFAIAEGLKKPTVLEVDRAIPNCCFHRFGAVHAWQGNTPLPPVQLRDHPPIELPPRHSDLILHVAHDMPLGADAESARIRRARGTWNILEGTDVAWRVALFNPSRTSRDLGDTRALPYLLDLFDFACERIGDDGIVVWTNLDVGIVPEAGEALRRRLSKAPVVYSRRVEHEQKNWQPSWDGLGCYAGDANKGMDLIAFRPSWWRSIRDEYPDFFIACDAFDMVLGHYARRDNPDGFEVYPPLLTHERHEPFWMDRKERWTNPALKHNHALAIDWCRRNGYAERMEAGEFSFWPEGKIPA